MPHGFVGQHELGGGIAWFGLWFGVSNDLNPADYVTEPLGGAEAYGSLYTGADVESTTLSTGTSLSRTMFAVPPRGVVVFEVALPIDYDNDDGNIEAISRAAISDRMSGGGVLTAEFAVGHRCG